MLDHAVHPSGLAAVQRNRECGTAPERWDALLKSLDFGYDDVKITFGELLDILATQQPAPTNPA
ncbi:hypothetical protein GCM10020367_70620 [Streptomyces sannanensis]|uniref:Uncharacterized protein n=1 Tax=Streptomyces sannanensis TaxID=285536 RepID=A0ABP6SMS6_9ACTN